MEQHNIQTTPLEPLTWETSEFRELYKLYWLMHSSQFDIKDRYTDRSGPYDDFYRKNGYLASPMPGKHEMLNNDIHPVFHKANWMAEFREFDEWYAKVSPAFQLASMFLSHPYMLKFWVHLRYGHAGFENGWVSLVEDPIEQDPPILEKIQDELRQVAKTVKFAFRAAEDMKDYVGFCEPNLLYACNIMENTAKRENIDCLRGLWYNPWNPTDCPTIFLHVDQYSKVFYHSTPMYELESNMHRAILLMHELAHACVKLWQPNTCSYHEPIVQISDIFPEAGFSWEQFALGGLILPMTWSGPTCCAEVEHVYPPTNPHALRLTVPIPASYFTQWFRRDTWEHLTERLDQLRVPSISRQTRIYQTRRLHGSSWVDHLIVDGKALPVPSLHDFCAEHPLHDDDYVLAPEEPLIPTSAGDIISRYQKIQAIDLDRKEKLEGSIPFSPHLYWHLTKLCCPYSQLNQLVDLGLIPADSASLERYTCVTGCWRCFLGDDEDCIAHPVPYSQCVEPEWPSKRTLFMRRSNAPVRCGLEQSRNTYRRARRELTRVKLEHIDPSCLTPSLIRLVEEGLDRDEAI